MSTADNPLQGVEPIWEGQSGPVIIAGPCSAETPDVVINTAKQLTPLHTPHSTLHYFRAGIWKPRTSPDSYQGPGAEALEWLAKAKAQTGMLTCTEVATPEHVEAALQAGVDMLWIGARTTTNPFAVEAVAEAVGRIKPDTPVLVKNPLNPDVDLWIGAMQRLINHGVKRLGAVHRGFSAYAPGPYRNAPGWHVAMELRRRCPGVPLLLDPSHLGGRRDLILPLSQRALDMGYDGLMIECHCSPDKALSDASQQVTPDQLAEIVGQLRCRPTAATAHDDYLGEMRQRLDALDHELLDILARRMATAREIGRYKEAHGIAVVQPRRHAQVLDTRAEEGQGLGLDRGFVRSLMSLVHEQSVAAQCNLQAHNP